MKIIEIKIGDSIPYIWKTEKYGRAEFEFCPVYKYGYLKEIYIYPRQQNINKIYVVKIDYKVRNFQIEGTPYETNERHWLNYWCKEHKTICQTWYVPSNSYSLKISAYSQEICLTFK